MFEAMPGRIGKRWGGVARQISAGERRDLFDLMADLRELALAQDFELLAGGVFLLTGAGSSGTEVSKRRLAVGLQAVGKVLIEPALSEMLNVGSGQRGAIGEAGDSDLGALKASLGRIRHGGDLTIDLLDPGDGPFKMEAFAGGTKKADLGEVSSEFLFEADDGDEENREGNDERLVEPAHEGAGTKGGRRWGLGGGHYRPGPCRACWHSTATDIDCER